MSERFAEQFRNLTGHAEPLSWQTRLFDRFKAGLLPSTIDLPTGLGKTMVMAIWLIAREKNPELPRRLVYVVDRRTVVDQATDIAIKLRDKAKSILNIDIAISTLRGQLADNREWSADPTRPAIIIGTVDLIGSALLFSGYRSSYKRRPLEAGLLGQNSLLVLDEAHLSRPFDKLLESIEQFNRRGTGVPKVEPLKVIRMSATTSNGNGEKFTLDEQDLQHPVINERFAATKTLSITTLGEKDKLNDKLADAAVQLATGEDVRGKRIVVFVRSPDSARAIAERIRSHASTKTKPRPFADSVEVLTGTMRGLERDELVEKPVMKRFLDGEEKPGDKDTDPVFLISTSAGEVGFDLNADHMVCDATTIDSLIQRLGRVNRRGKGNAKVVLVLPKQPADKTEFDKACIEATKLLTDGMSLSPEAIAALKRSLTSEQLKAASTPEPATVELTDILLDNWSMTSINEPMPGRPDVAPWLRGIDEEQAQTTVAWRAELDLFRDDPSPEKPLQAIFARHPIRPHESLTVNTRHLIDEFLKKLGKLKDRPDDLLYTRVAIRLPRGQVVCRSIEQLIDDPGILFAESTLILPARFGGLDNGLLSVEALPMSRKPDEPPPDSLDVADQSGYEPTDSPRSRLRLLINRDAEHGTWTPQPLPGGVPFPDDVQLDDSYETSTRLFNALKDAGFRVRLVQPVAFDEDDNVTQSLVMLAPASKHRVKEDQSLAEHVAEVESQAQRIADQLQLTGTIRDALLFAAKWHDEGKKALIWQRFANGPMPDGQPKGKTAQARDPKSLKHYRHEFGSLLRVHHPDRCDKIDCTLPADQATRDLALHLIAAHHGGGRPHFPEALYDPFTDDERDQTHTDAIRRFARLQRHFGWWRLAWLENLLRCADALASASAASDTEEDETEELA